MNMDDGSRDMMTSFLSQGSSDDDEYAPKSGQIVGILKQMLDTMMGDDKDAKAAEDKAIKTYESLMAAKKKEIEALTKAIEEKTARLGEVGVEAVNMANDLEDTKTALAEDKQFLADMDKNCATKEKEWAERSKTRSAELIALADTIKILNDDDALELFKKTLPSPSLLQTKVTSKQVSQRAQQILRGHHDYRLDLISLALHGQKVNFDKVIKMIDDMVELLGKEQTDDDNKKAECEASLDAEEDKLKELEHTISDLEKTISDLEQSISTTTEELAALTKGITDLDKQVAEATEQRKEEHEDYVETMANDSAAKELLAIAKNRLNKFYNPKLYKAPPKAEMSAEDATYSAMGGEVTTAAPGGIAGTGVTVFAQLGMKQEDQAAPPPPPATWDAYSKKSGESTGVISMIDLLIADLDKEMTVAKTEENDAQGDYETMMADSTEKRTVDTKTLADKEQAKADTEVSLEESIGAKKAATKELMATLKYIQSLHAECDWLLQYFDMRKEARTGEIDALVKAKAVLSGADYSLLQTSKRGLLRR